MGKVTILLASIAAAVLLAGGIIVAATINADAKNDRLSGTSERDEKNSGSRDDNMQGPVGDGWIAGYLGRDLVSGGVGAGNGVTVGDPCAPNASKDVQNTLLCVLQEVSWPLHQPGGTFCFDYNKIWTKVPTQMLSWNGTTQLESVYWRPIVYRYNHARGRWGFYASEVWMQAYANVYGLRSPWSRTDNNIPYEGSGNGPVFYGVPSGTYAVLEVYYWPSSGRYHNHWSYLNNGGNQSWQCGI